jgi:hypothetical protein
VAILSFVGKFWPKLFHKIDPRSHFHRLNFLPDYPELKSINAAIRDETHQRFGTDFKSFLAVIISSVADCDNVEVKSQTLSEMSQVNITVVILFLFVSLI